MESETNDSESLYSNVNVSDSESSNTDTLDSTFDDPLSFRELQSHLRVPCESRIYWQEINGV